MSISIVRYLKVSTPYTVHQIALPDSQGIDDQVHCTELVTLPDGFTYVAVPDGVTLPQQPTEITVEPVTLTPESATTWSYYAYTAPSIIRIAEGNGMIGVLTEWVLNTSLRHQSEWKHLGTNIDIAVNLSTITLGDGQLPGMIGQALGIWQADPAHLTLEITEDATINDMEYSLTIMNQLKKMGPKLSVDDFGTGYSSLQYLKRLPLYQLKIDQSFVRDIAVDSSDQAIVRTIIAMAHTLNLNVIAEGVETEEQQGLLLNNGCTHYQGYFYGRPVPIEQFEVLLKPQ